MRSILLSVLLLILMFAQACAYEPMNTVEFEHHLDKDFGLIALYGIGYGDYNDAGMPSDFLPFGPSLKEMYASNSVGAKLVHLGSPRVVVGTQEGEKAVLPLRWVGEIPPREFNGKLFIRVFNLKEGLLHWDTDPFATWEYGRSNE